MNRYFHVGRIIRSFSYNQRAAQMIQYDTNAAKVVRISYDVSVCFQVAMSTMDNPLLKYNAKEYFFKASLCHFIVDELNAKVTPTSL